MGITMIDVKKAGRYLDGTGRAYELESGKMEVNPSLAQRLVEVNPDAITVVGSESGKAAPQDEVFD